MAGREIRIGGIFVDLVLGTNKFESDIKRAQSNLRKFGNEMGKIGGSLTRNLSAPMAVLGAAAVAASLKIDDAYDRIRAGTGATGKALEGLQKSFDRVLRNVPDSIDNVGKAISEIHTRTGMAGKSLELFAQQTLALSRLTNTDISQNIAASTRAFGAWGIEAEKGGDALDFLFKTSQKTGTGITTLMQQVGSSAPVLRQLGLGFQESAALLGLFEREGVNAQAALSGLRNLLPILAKNGIDFATGFQASLDTIKNAKSEVEATTIAMGLFGKKAGAELAVAIRSGRFEFDQFLKALQQSPESIRAADEATRGFAENMLQLMNNATLAMKPFGDEITKALGPVVGGLGDMIGELGEQFSKLPTSGKQFAVTLGAIVAVAGPAGIILKNMSFTLAALLSPLGLAVVRFGVFAGAIELAVSALDKLDRKLGTANGPGFVIDYLAEGFDALVSRIPMLQRRIDTFAREAAEKMKAAGQKPRWYDDAEETAAAVDGVTSSLDGYQKRLTDALTGNKELGETLKGIGTGADEARKEIENLTEQWEKTRRAFDQQRAEKNLDKAISDRTLGPAEFEAQISDLQQTLEQGFFEDFKLQFGDAISDQDLWNEAERRGLDAIETWRDRYVQEMSSAHKETIDLWRNLFENAITGTTFNLEDALRQVAVGFAAEITASLTQSMGLGNLLRNIRSPQDLGGMFATFVLPMLMGGGGGSIQGAVGQGIAQYLGYGATGAGAAYYGGALAFQGQQFYNGAMGYSAYGPYSTGYATGQGTSYTAGSYAPYLAWAAAAYQNYESWKNYGDHEHGGTTKAVSTTAGTVIGGIIGAYFGGPAGAAFGAALGSTVGAYAGEHIAKAIGAGITNNEYKNRLQFGATIEGMMREKQHQVSFFDEQGQPQRQLAEKWTFPIPGGKEFDEDKNWTKYLDSLDEKTRGVFLGLGEGFEGLLDIAENQGGQFAAILAENLVGSIDNARYLVQKLGLSFEDMSKKMGEAALKGSMRWSEYVTYIRGLEEAFKPGLAAEGDFLRGWDTLIESGGRGMDAVIGIKNAFVEAQEAGIDSFAKWKEQLLAGGKNPEYVNAFFSALEQRGVQTFEQLSALSDIDLGGIVGTMEQSSGALTETWSSMTAKLDELNEKIAQIPEDVESNVNIKFQGDLDRFDALVSLMHDGGSYQGGGEPVKQQALGGVVSSPTFFRVGGRLHSMAEGGRPEGILPLGRVNGRLGVHAQLDGLGAAGGGRRGRDRQAPQLHIHMPGAEAGSEQRLLAALQEHRNDIVSSTVDAVMDLLDRID